MGCRAHVISMRQNGKIHIDTPFSRLLGKPPLMVAGMTPTTVKADFVSAVQKRVITSNLLVAVITLQQTFAPRSQKFRENFPPAWG
jgi:enoyl reductase-like protein